MVSPIRLSRLDADERSECPLPSHPPGAPALITNAFPPPIEQSQNGKTISAAQRRLHQLMTQRADFSGK
ncbi:hypothetical protein J6590_020166 [Homalodisca vitripennis]|nr:hypothetical protein J6590_020166 [Homalodisca vitripennis]